MVRLFSSVGLCTWLALAAACDPRARGSGSPDGLLTATDKSVSQRLGWGALEQQHWPEAQMHFEAVIAIDANLVDAWLGLGHALFWQQYFREAQRAWERANALEPQHPRALGGVAHCELNLAMRSWNTPAGRRAKLLHAQALLERALALEPHDRGAIEGLTFVRVALARAGAPPLALELFAVAALLGLALCATLRIRAHGWTALRASRRALRAVLPAFLCTRGLVLLGFLLSPRLLADAPKHPLSLLADAHDPILRAVAQRWDSNLYADVALEGYRAQPDIAGMWSSLGQLPLTPILYRFSMYALGDAHIAALLLPHLALLIACMLLFMLLRDAQDETLARRAVLVLLLLPGSLFGSVLYAEPIALVFMLGAELSLRRARLTSSFLSGLLAGMARVNALSLLPLLGAQLMRERARLPRRALLVLAGPLLGLSAFMLYTHFAFGDALAYVHELRAHRFAGQGVLVAFDDARRQLSARDVATSTLALLVLSATCVVAYAAAAIVALRRGDLGAGLCILTGIFFAFGSSLAAQPRYLWLAFPACAYFAAWPKTALARVLATLVLGVLLFLEAVAYAAWYYVT